MSANPASLAETFNDEFGLVLKKWKAEPTNITLAIKLSVAARDYVPSVASDTIMDEMLCITQCIIVCLIKKNMLNPAETDALEQVMTELLSQHKAWRQWLDKDRFFDESQADFLLDNIKNSSAWVYHLVNVITSKIEQMHTEEHLAFFHEIYLSMYAEHKQSIISDAGAFMELGLLRWNGAVNDKYSKSIRKFACNPDLATEMDVSLYFEFVFYWLTWPTFIPLSYAWYKEGHETPCNESKVLAYSCDGLVKENMETIHQLYACENPDIVQFTHEKMKHLILLLESNESTGSSLLCQRFLTAAIPVHAMHCKEEQPTEKTGYSSTLSLFAPIPDCSSNSSKNSSREFGSPRWCGFL